MDIVGRIDAWSRTRPNNVAHVSGARQMTYAELSERSDAVAAYLSRRVPDNRSPIAVVGQKESEMVTGFLGCIKAGHPYVPLDNTLPRQRIDDIVSVAGVGATLTPEVIREAERERGQAGPIRPLSAADPFYIIFTSGSTGTPKGVPITLECLTDFLEWMEDEQQFRDTEVFLNQVPYSFDVSIMDTYLGLLTGGTVFSIDREQITNPIKLYQALASSGVTIWVSTPTFVQVCLVERRFDQTMLPGVDRFFLAGEALAPSLVAQLHDRFPNSTVWNMYGPTEATVVVTSVRIDREMVRRYPSLPIGFPKPRTRIEILDNEGRSVAPGERGEIVIAGPNVSPGYLNRPDATERAFFRRDGLRAYRTGDAGHYEDGMVFFDGRLDSQVKLHGFRIELGDVETHLRALSRVQEAVVLPVTREGRVEALQAFVILTGAREGSDFEMANALRAQLAERLPAHMLPRKFRFLDTFPMTANGKVDRQNLAGLA